MSYLSVKNEHAPLARYSRLLCALTVISSRCTARHRVNVKSIDPSLLKTLKRRYRRIDEVRYPRRSLSRREITMINVLTIGCGAGNKKRTR